MSFSQAPPAAAGAPTPEAPSLRRDWALFTALTFLFGFGFAVYAGVFQNFLREVLHAGPLRMGGLESLREIPGLLTAITAGSLVALAESRVGVLGLVITAVGIGVTGSVPGFWLLVAVTMFWSVGFHLWMSVSPAITLALARGKEGGRHLGRMQAVGSAATLSALGFAWVLAQLMPGQHYSLYFFLAGGCILAAAVLCGRLSTHAAGAPRARIILRREYGLYYLLTFLEGCRRQIFAIFASYALIAVYHVPLRGMLALQFVNAILIAVTAPAMGRLIDRRGERGPLTFYSVALIVVFLGYATIPNVTVLYGLFLFDNVLFSFNVGFTTYLHRIVRPRELTPCLAMGLTMNHVAAVTVPVSGAWLWQHSHNYQLPFWVGVAIAGVSLIATRWLPRDAALPALHVVPEEATTGS
jgi:hypothetical protein